MQHDLQNRNVFSLYLKVWVLPKSSTLNGRYALYGSKDMSFRAHHKNMNENRAILSAAKM